MSIRVTCNKCSKKIQVDDAFAGGICRCPYCKALVSVKARVRAAAPTRPDTPPTRQAPPAGRPETPSLASAPTSGSIDAARRALAGAPIPLARPVRLTPAVMLMAIGAFALLAIIAIIVFMWPSPSRPAQPTPSPAPAVGNSASAPAVTGPAIAGMSLQSPVLYCVDTAGTETYSFAARMVRHSVQSLKDGEFNIVLVNEGAEKYFSKSFQKALGQDAAVGSFLAGATPGGATDLSRGVAHAIARKPASLVVLTRKGMGASAIQRLREQAAAGNTTIYCVGLDAATDAASSLTQLAGDPRHVAVLSMAALDRWNAATPED